MEPGQVLRRVPPKILDADWRTAWMETIPFVLHTQFVH